MFDNFPFNNLETFKFSLLSLPFVYQTIKENDSKDLLTRKGDFLVELSDSNFLLLHLRSDNEQILIFQIKFCIIHDPERIGFSFGDKEFTTLPGLISHFCNNKFHCNGNNLKLKSAIYRRTINGSFGYGTDVTLKNGNKAFIRSLNIGFTANSKSTSEILEELILIKNKRICCAKDYDYCHRGDGIPPIILVRYDYYSSNLADFVARLEDPLPTRHYVFWAYQVSKALEYLCDKEMTCERLCLRSCLLDVNEKIKLTDFWKEGDGADCKWWYPKKAKLLNNCLLEETMMRNDYWRNVSPEVLLGQGWTYQSLVWSFALFFQQLVTHGKYPNRCNYASLADFINIDGGKDDSTIFPNTKCNLHGKSPSFQTLYKIFQSSSFPIPPSDLVEFLTKCLNFDPAKRPSFTELLEIIGKEAKLFKLIAVFNRF